MSIFNSENELQAFNLLRDIVAKSRNGDDYEEQLVQLKKIMPNAPDVGGVIRSWCMKYVNN